MTKEEEIYNSGRMAGMNEEIRMNKAKLSLVARVDISPGKGGHFDSEEHQKKKKLLEKYRKDNYIWYCAGELYARRDFDIGSKSESPDPEMFNVYGDVEVYEFTR